ncbi:MAG: phosphoenolpyruvate carboxykinase (ATP) [Vagococcus sp.]
MSTYSNHDTHTISASNTLFTSFRTLIETTFFGNNVDTINSLSEAYQLAKTSPGTIVTDLSVMHTSELGLPDDTKVLVFNDGKVVGRTAAARKIIGQPNVDANYFNGLLREAIFNSRQKHYYHGQAVVGLDEDFMVKTHILLPNGYENNLYSYLLNFQYLDSQFTSIYQKSKHYEEGDIYIYGDPDWTHPDFPNGLAILSPKDNVAAILGLRYFGEFKKATLSLAWAMSNRHRYIPCHGGAKQFRIDDHTHTAAFFGLSGSGKSTLTLANHNHKFDIRVLHDDAFIIDKTNGKSISLEPSYFDKTQDYPMTNEAVNYFLTCQNVGVTLNETNHKVLVTEDIRNGNGRTVKSRYVIPNRVNSLSTPIDSVFWIMKDDSFPPLIKINNPVLASIFGATLATKRSTAENVIGTEHSDHKLVIEPFANPFRCYPLSEDYDSFYDLFESGVSCYVLNTGFFNKNKVTPKQTLSSIESIVTQTHHLKSFAFIDDISYLPVAGHIPDFNNDRYKSTMKERLKHRLDFIEQQEHQLDGYNALPIEAKQTLQRIIDTI